MRFSHLIVFASLPLTGCVLDPRHVEDDFGKSVKQMISAQIYDPKAASQPDELPPLLLDGEVAGTSMDGYREDAKRKEKSDSNLTITID